VASAVSVTYDVGGTSFDGLLSNVIFTGTLSANKAEPSGN
jgi:hypothetical protein